MKVAGIVAEYNPFHNGHAHQIERTRAEKGGCEATHIVAVMSGHFVQRGEPALLPKQERVRAALAGGVDLVLELPLPWSLSSAERFAFGAVSLLDALGCVDIISFGSECGDAAALERAAAAMEDDHYLRLLKYRMEQGISAPEAQQKALAEVANSRAAALLDSPNNILGIEYIKALRRLGSPIRPFTVPRLGADHDSLYPIGSIASATYLRTLARENRWMNAAPFVPPNIFDQLTGLFAQGHAPANEALLERAMLARLRGMTAGEMAACANVSEGLENRLYAASRTAGSLPALLEAVKTKRYPLTRVRRLVWSVYWGLPAALSAGCPPYIRVLGISERGSEVLAAIKKASPALPLLTRASHAEALTGDARTVWELENRAADLYGLALPVPLPCGMEVTAGMIKP